MTRQIAAQGDRPFRFARFSAVQFIILTLIAMLLYPGGTAVDTTTSGYSFSQNFFSTLGLITARNGAPNTASALLFFVALTVAGVGLMVFFVGLLPLQWKTPVRRVLAITGTAFGVFAGVSFVGVAFTPADLFPAQHGQFVLWAFQSFLGAVLFHMVLVLLNRRYPNVYALVYALFAVALGAYIWLLFNGPGVGTGDGLRTQAIGQKLIVYAAIVTVWVQSFGAIMVRGASEADELATAPAD